MALVLVKMDDIICSFVICLRFAPSKVRHLAMADLAFYPLHPETFPIGAAPDAPPRRGMQVE